MADNEFDVQEKETRQYISVKIGEEKYCQHIIHCHNCTDDCLIQMKRILQN